MDEESSACKEDNYWVRSLSFHLWCLGAGMGRALIACMWALSLICRVPALWVPSFSSHFGLGRHYLDWVDFSQGPWLCHHQDSSEKVGSLSCLRAALDCFKWSCPPISKTPTSLYSGLTQSFLPKSSVASYFRQLSTLLWTKESFIFIFSFHFKKFRTPMHLS